MIDENNFSEGELYLSRPYFDSINFSNGNVIDDLLMMNGANDNGVVKDDNSTATAFPTHHTIIVPAPMDVRRDRNSRDETETVHYVPLG